LKPKPTRPDSGQKNETHTRPIYLRVGSGSDRVRSIIDTPIVNQNWSLYQIDMKNTFLQGILNEEVYMTMLLGHEKLNDSNFVCKLNKSIYALKQSSQAWYEKLSSYLIFYDFKISNADHSLF
jgi:Reverse transcriptase (RNA-dependent DNA polymerase)